MPNPLSKVNPRASVIIANSTDTPSIDRPELAHLAMTVIAQWSILDSWLNGLFVKMLGSQSAAATAIYTSLSGSAAKKSAFDAVAKQSLSKEQMEVFVIIMSLIGKAANQRNNIAHWVWGHSPDIPDGALLCDPIALMKYNAELEIFNRLPPNTQNALPEIPKEKIYVYVSSDFTTLSETIRRLMGYVMSFRFALSPNEWFGGDQELAELIQKPEIQQALVRSRAKNR